MLKERNEGKILMMQYDLLKTDLKILRENARRLTVNQDFCQLVAEARKANALSDDKQLEETLRDFIREIPRCALCDTEGNGLCSC